MLAASLMLSMIAWGAGVPISHQLPTDGPLPKTYNVTLAIVDQDETSWVISNFLAAQPRTVTTANQGQVTDDWDGLDENGMPVPPGSYTVKGIYLPASEWSWDGKYHALTANYLSAPGGSFALASATSTSPSRRKTA